MSDTVLYILVTLAAYVGMDLYADYRWLLYVGIGISLYGLTYFLIHDVYIHQRFKWFKQLDSKYSRAILKAHGAHHSITGKHDCESFGLLVVEPKFFKKVTENK